MKLKWKSRTSYNTAKLSALLQQWVGTPYREGQSCKGVGVDCVRFGIAIACDMADIPMINIPREAPRTSLFTPEKSYQVVSKIRKQLPMYNNVLQERETVVHPGDIVVARNGKGPGHMMVVGVRPNSLYHAIDGEGVVMTGLCSVGTIEHIWRL